MLGAGTGEDTGTGIMGDAVGDGIIVPGEAAGVGDGIMAPGVAETVGVGVGEGIIPPGTGVADGVGIIPTGVADGVGVGIMAPPPPASAAGARATVATAAITPAGAIHVLRFLIGPTFLPRRCGKDELPPEQRECTQACERQMKTAGGGQPPPSPQVSTRAARGCRYGCPRCP